MTKIIGTPSKPDVAQKQADKILSGEGNTNTRAKEAIDMNAPVRVEEVLPEEVYEPVTYEMVKRAYSGKASTEMLEMLVENINEVCMGTDELQRPFFKDNFIGLLDIMTGTTKNTMNEYINAAKFITYKQLGFNNVKAYAKTFPDRIQSMADKGIPNTHLHAYASAFYKSSLVTKMQAQVMMPAYLLHQDIFNEAVITQAQIMKDTSVSPKVRSDAANSLMTHLKTPEIKKMELNVGIKETSLVEDFKEQLANLARQQRGELVDGSCTLVEVSNSTIYETEND